MGDKSSDKAKQTDGQGREDSNETGKDADQDSERQPKSEQDKGGVAVGRGKADRVVGKRWGGINE
jgi:hypothetical protein